jgi:hypothetical protein
MPNVRFHTRFATGTSWQTERRRALRHLASRLLKGPTMSNRAALLASLLVTASAASALADDTQTTTAGTVVVVTPSAPVIVPQSAAPGAIAETTPVPAPNAPPQNEDWNNVSHINGTPVKVGERGDYLYRFRKTQVSVDPIALMFGVFDADLAHALSNNVAIDGSVMAWSTDHGDSSGYQVTASIPIYLRRTFSGPFIEPGLIIRESSHNYYDSYCANGDYGCSSGDNTHRWAGPEMLLGWQATFDSGLTMKAAFGVARHMASNQMNDYSDDEADVNGYFRVGYAF